MEDIGKCYGELMKGLGFTSYIAQGSDVGGTVIDYISTMFDECKSTCTLLLNLEYGVTDDSDSCY
jgi:hypothetical protein